jgi:hypothetical protein
MIHWTYQSSEIIILFIYKKSSSTCLESGFEVKFLKPPNS